MGKLEEMLRALQVPQPVMSEVPQARSDREILARQLADRARHQHLAAVREPTDPGAAIRGGPPPIGFGGVRLSGEQRHADPDLQIARPVLALHGALDLERACQCVRRPREQREGGIALAALLQQRPATCRHGGGDQLSSWRRSARAASRRC